MLTVADTGTGVPADELPRLFERFHRVERAQARSGEGSGIGLAMVRELVGLHGGTITVESAPRRGTTFPVTPAVGARPPAVRAGRADVHERGACGRRTVRRGGAALAARRRGPSGPAAPVGAGAATACSSPTTTPTCASTWPGCSGRATRCEVVSDGAGGARGRPGGAARPRRQRRDDAGSRRDGAAGRAARRPADRPIPVLLLSARAGQEAAVEGLAAGADDYLVKPFSAAELLARVGAHLQLGRARREAEARFTAIADLAPALIWVAGRSGARVFVNAGWRQFTGRAARRAGRGLAGRPAPRGPGALPRDGGRRDGGRDRGWEVEFRLRRADGVYRWLLERAVPIGPTEPGGSAAAPTSTPATGRPSGRACSRGSARGWTGRPASPRRSPGWPGWSSTRRLADLCCVLRVDDDGRLRRDGIAAVDADAEAAVAGIHPESPTVREVVTTGRPRLIADVPEVGSPEWSAADAAPDQLALYRRIAVRSALLVPLSARGRVLGVLALLRRRDSPPLRRRRPRAGRGDRGPRRAGAGQRTAARRGAGDGARGSAVLQRATAAAVRSDDTRRGGRRRRRPPRPAARRRRHRRRVRGRQLRAALAPLALEGVDDAATPGSASCRCRPRSPWRRRSTSSGRCGWTTSRLAGVGRAPSGGGPTTSAGCGIRGVVALPLAVGGRAVGVIGVGFRVPAAVRDRAGHAAGAGRAVRPGPGPGPALPRRAPGRRDPAAQPAAAAAAPAPAPRAGRPVPARRRGRPGGRRLVRRDRARRAPRRDRGGGRGRAGARRGGGHGAAAQRAGRRTAAGAAGRPRRWNCSTGSPHACPGRARRRRPA